MNFFTFFTILAITLVSCESFRLDSIEANVNNDRIIGGSTARRGQFPYTVALRGRITLSNNTIVWRHMCGGSILNNRWILSAAHCTLQQFSNVLNVIAVAGAHHIQNDGRIYRLDRIINHPRYSTANKNNDISLLRTNEQIQFNNFVRQISLRRQFVDAGVASIVSGWGLTQQSNTGVAFPTHLQFLPMNTLSNSECLRRHSGGGQRYIHNETICAFSRRGQGVCTGDSGGPLVANRQLIGIVSWGGPCGGGMPDGYMRVAPFLNWIRQVSGITII